MALSSGHPFPTNPTTISITPFWENTTITPGPFCSIPTLSLDTTRIASLTSLSPLDCGQCISICALTTSAFYECTRALLVDTNTLNTTTLEIGPDMFSELVIDDVDQEEGEGDTRWAFMQGTEVTLELVEQALCVGVWDGEVLGTGEEPKGLLKGYMVDEDYEWGRRGRRWEGRGAGEGKSKGGGQAGDDEASPGEAESGKRKGGEWWGVGLRWLVGRG
ncbi:hypothetical protein G7Y79_00047g083490 [Physcia stellaris]|nr:hypothetical protein G7Y79_00047g083490 [Physcia stellaris]